MGSQSQSGVQRVAQPIAQDVQGEYGEHNRPSGKCGDPPLLAQVLSAFAQHATPFGCRRLTPQTEETQCGGYQYGGSDAQGAHDDDWRDHVWQDVSTLGV